MALAAAGLLTLAAAPALAAFGGHGFSTSITGSGTNALTTPTSVAVDNSALSSAGSVYVADSATERVEKFDSAGNFVLMFGKGVNLTTGGDVCPSPGNPGDVCQAGTSGSAAGQFTTPTFIAVDSSAGLSAGDVYVADTGTHLVQKFAPDGTLITGWGGTPAGGQLDGSTSGSGTFGSIAGITVDSSGNLEVFNTSARLFKFAQDGTFTTTFTTARGTDSKGLAVDAAGNFFKVNGDDTTEKFGPTGSDGGQVTSSASAAGLAFDPSANDLYVDNGSNIGRYHFNGSGEVVQANSTTCTPASFSGCGVTESFGSGNLSGARGLDVNRTSGKIYAADTGNHRVAVFTAIINPDVTTGDPSNVSQTSATVSGHVDLGGGSNITDCHFEYVTDVAFQATRYTDLSSGGSKPCTPAIPPAYSSGQDVSANLTGLTTSTTYHVRLVASSATGTGTGDQVDKVFTTDPAVFDVSTDAPTDVAQTSATLNGSFSGNHGNQPYSNTYFYFQWGTDQSNYEHITAAPPGIDAGASSGTINVSAPITGLTTYLPASPSYHYRLVVTNSIGTTYGPDRAFHSAPPFLPQISGTASSGVSPTAATLSALVNPGNGDTVYTFEYGPDTSYGSFTPTSDSIGSDNTDHPVSAELSGLTPGTTYHYRAVALNFGGTAHGPDRTFTTPDVPRVDSTSSSAIGKTSAHLSAWVDPNSSPTSAHFEYGVSSAYGQSTADSPIGSDALVHEAGADISGLTPNTTYHFRVIATNGLGTTTGPDQTFTTASSPPAVTPPPPPKPKHCKAGFVKKHGKCVKKKPKHHKRSARHG